MYRLVQSNDPEIIEVGISRWEYMFGFDPFHDLLFSYSVKYGLKIKIVDFLYEYRFYDDEFDLKFYWFQLSRIFIHVPRRQNYNIAEHRIIELIKELNTELKKRRAAGTIL